MIVVCFIFVHKFSDGDLFEVFLFEFGLKVTKWTHQEEAIIHDKDPSPPKKETFAENRR